MCTENLCLYLYYMFPYGEMHIIKTCKYMYLYISIYWIYVQFSRSVVSDSLRPHGLQYTRLPCLSPTLEFAQTHVHQFGDAIQPSHLCHPLLLLPSIFPSIRVFSNESVLCIRWPKYWTFSFSISPSNEYSDWFPLGWTGWISLQSKGLKSLLQHHSSKASVLWVSAFFIVQLSHPYILTK